MDANEKIEALRTWWNNKYSKDKVKNWGDLTDFPICGTTGAIKLQYLPSILVFLEKLKELEVTVISITQNAGIYTVFFQA